ncbi:3-dehydroquinate synthase [Bacillus carboniphilus]|uniref:3-dehydroquinate synthase n=1 Tax=Bacillus carboniphilus TaxID=86663 RepID=A0ABY9JWG7_9BACI|nr:3-dehydroquinate synthase [Bacillus carboniphilus]WLR43737.1 3-dehydroquinate synthase [Bacillus carboniphilus]
MERIWVHATSKSYPVLIGQDILATFPEVIKEVVNRTEKVLIYVDENVYSYHYDQLISILQPHFKEVFTYIVPSGESSKSFQQYYDGITFALEKGLNRKSLILAFGGGVVGDLTGFIASTYMRGIPYIQIPTTLLAHDSAIGGKVAINHPLGKNLIGAFYQPNAVFFETSFLKTLSHKQWLSGLAEVIKYGFIDDPDFLMELQKNVQKVEDLSDSFIKKIISKGIKIKAKIVKDDEQEKGVRAYLNFGHTLGHAIESLYGYGKVTHGSAVATGMMFALWLSENISEKSLHYLQLLNWMTQMGYQSTIDSTISTETFVEKMKQDKKSTDDYIKMVLLDRIGHPFIKDFTKEELMSYLNIWRQEGKK